MTVSIAPAITISRRITILKTLKTWQTISIPGSHMQRIHTFINAIPTWGVNPWRIVTKTITIKKWGEVKVDWTWSHWTYLLLQFHVRPRDLPFGLLPQECLESVSSEENKYCLRNSYLLAKIYQRSQGTSYWTFLNLNGVGKNSRCTQPQWILTILRSWQK